MPIIATLQEVRLTALPMSLSALAIMCQLIGSLIRKLPKTPYFAQFTLNGYVAAARQSCTHAGRSQSRLTDDRIEMYSVIPGVGHGSATNQGFRFDRVHQSQPGIVR